MSYYVYILKSSIDGKLYKGIAKDPIERLKQHNAGKTRSTKGYRPWVLVYKEAFNSRIEARNKEIYFKSGIGREKLKSILDP